MPIHTKSDLVVEICRADSDDHLEVLIGATINFWKVQGFDHFAVNYVTPSAGVFGCTLRHQPGGAPANVAHDLTNAFTAVVVLTGST